MFVAARGKTAVAVVTEEFAGLARTMAANAGRPSLRVLVLPYPLETRPAEEVQDIGRSHFGPLLRALGVRDRVADERTG